MNDYLIKKISHKNNMPSVLRWLEKEFNEEMRLIGSTIRASIRQRHCPKILSHYIDCELCVTAKIIIGSKETSNIRNSSISMDIFANFCHKILQIKCKISSYYSGDIILYFRSVLLPNIVRKTLREIEDFVVKHGESRKILNEKRILTVSEDMVYLIYSKFSTENTYFQQNSLLMDTLYTINDKRIRQLVILILKQMISMNHLEYDRIVILLLSLLPHNFKYAVKLNYKITSIDTILGCYSLFEDLELAILCQLSNNNPVGSIVNLQSNG